jgi:class 3 adenylate cyclase
MHRDHTDGHTLLVDPRLQQYIDDLGPDRWAALILDADSRLVWVSDEMRAFLGAGTDDELGIGDHVIAALFRPTWRAKMTLDSQFEIFTQAFPYLIDRRTPTALIESLPPEFRELIAEVKPVDQPAFWTGSFDYVYGDLPAYRVEFVCSLLRDDTGARIGNVLVTNMGLRPTLLASLGRGDANMYERMSRLQEPGRHATAILFADLEGSGELSRQLPTAAYFGVIRDLSSAFDATVAENLGIVGKHAGDGWTAFFLADDTGGASCAARTAIQVARELQARADDIGAKVEVAGSESGRLPLRINVGIHWGPGVYLGQLVPGGRLDVTALGDEVNECARIQECARDGAVFASKQVVELLVGGDAAAVRVDPSTVMYESLAAMPRATDKTRRDAPTIAVTDVAVRPAG